MHSATTAFCNSVPPSSTAFAPVNWPPKDEPVMEMVNDAFGVKNADRSNRAAHKRNVIELRRRRDKIAKASRRRNRR